MEEENRKGVQTKREVTRFTTIHTIKDFRFRYKLRRRPSELGPLQYLSGLTGYGMDRIINWLILIIIFVFDPLAKVAT